MCKSIDRFWAQKLGVSPHQLREPGVHVVSNTDSGFSGYSGVFFFSRDQALVVTAPPDAVRSLAEEARHLSAASIGDLETLRRAIGPAAGSAIGPAFQGFVEPDALVWQAPVHEVALADPGSKGLRELRASCSEAEWEVSGLRDVSAPLAVVTEGDLVLAAAGLRDRARGVADLCVLTRPDLRGTGLATDLLGYLASSAVEEGTLVLYQTLLANEPAIRVAHRLGVRQYGTSTAIRFDAATDPTYGAAQ